MRPSRRFQNNNVFETVKYFFGAAMGFLGWGRQRSADKNTPDMKANAGAKTDTKIADEATKAVARDDLDAIRKGAAE